MKTSYYLVTAACLAAAAAVVYTQNAARSGARELPPPAEKTAAAAEPARFSLAEMSLPPIVTPPDTPLVIPVGNQTPIRPLPPMTAEPALAIPAVTPVAPPAATPPPPRVADPAPPAAPATVPVVKPVAPSAPPADTAPPTIPLPPVKPVAPPVETQGPALDPLPPIPAAPPKKPATPEPPASPVSPAVEPKNPPPPLAAPAMTEQKPALPVAPPPTPVLPKPAPLPVPATKQSQPLPLLPVPRVEKPAPTGPQAGKYVVLKGNKLIEGSVTPAGEKAIIRQGSFERILPKTEVLFVGDSRDAVYQFMLAQVPATDAAARLGVARWCMFAGLREQALFEAEEIIKLDPANIAAARMAKSLEESLRLVPADGSPPAASANPDAAKLDSDPAIDLTPEGATTFASRAQPVLANQCMECHARTDYAGEFKLIRVTGYEVGPQSTIANMRATANQLNRDDPLASPLLTRSLLAHGGMKQPAFAGRQAVAFRVLEAWVKLATPPAVAPMTPPMEPVFPESPAIPKAQEPPAIPIIPRIEEPPAKGADRGEPPPLEIPLPPVAKDANPPAAPLPLAPPTATPRTEPPQAIVPLVLPTPPNMPVTKVEFRHAKPATPMIPSTPKPPTSASPPGSSFGTQAPKPPAATKPTGRDEFDPDGFNRGK